MFERFFINRHFSSPSSLYRLCAPPLCSLLCLSSLLFLRFPSSFYSLPSIHIAANDKDTSVKLHHGNLVNNPLFGRIKDGCLECACACAHKEVSTHTGSLTYHSCTADLIFLTEKQQLNAHTVVVQYRAPKLIDPKVPPPTYIHPYSPSSMIVESFR